MKIMTLAKIIAIYLGSVALFGQIVITDPQDPRLQALQSTEVALRRILSQAASNPPASLVLLDTAEKDWGEAFDTVRREDPFALYNLNYIPLSVDNGAGSGLREREGWPEQTPRWAIINPEGRVVADGTSLPTSAQLADACMGARIFSKVETLRQFLREHPNHEEAQRAMLIEMVDVAEKRTRFALQAPESRTESRLTATVISLGSAGSRSSFGNDGGSNDPTAEQIENLPELTSDADERIWRDYCNELRKYMEGTTWRSAENQTVPGNFIIVRTGKSITSAWAIYSPLARATYSRMAGSVEDALTRQPSSTTLWRLWVSLQKTRATRPMSELLSDLEPSPTIPAANWPPDSIRAEYIGNCREIGDWKAIQDLVEPIWELQKTLGEVPRTIADRSSAGGTGTDRRVDIGNIFFNQGFWTTSIEPYLEALLMLGRLSDAEQVVQTWKSGSGWSGAFTSAANLAQKLGLESVAKAWREMGEEK